ncbi:MAG: tetratricopeptide repeat protein [Planctomycetaceae bacterium]|jgi:hypothetical protein|nr:tetratricopeptide repeat protein [Planctomycetaceae bacterium]
MSNTTFFKKIGQLFSVLIFLLAVTLWQGNGFFVVADDDGSDTIKTFIKRAKEYSDKNEHKKSLEMYQKAVALLTPDNVNSLEAADLYFDVGFVNYNQLKQYDEALVWLHKSLAIRERELGKDHLSTTRIYQWISECYDSKNNSGKALEYLLKELKGIEKEYGGNHFLTAHVYYNIGIQHEKQKNYEEALHFFLKSYQINWTNPDKNDTYLKLVLKHVKESYEKTHNDQAFDEWLQSKLKPATENPKKEKKQTGKMIAEILKLDKNDLKKKMEVAAKLLFENKKAAYDFSEKYSGEEKSQAIKEKKNKLDLALAESRVKVGELYEELGEFSAAFYYQFAAYLTYEDILGVNNRTSKELLEKVKTNLNQTEENGMYKNIIEEAENSSSKLVADQLGDARLLFGESLEDMENRELKKEFGTKRKSRPRSIFNR